jgi:predicted nucleotidyltransferase
MEIQIKKAIKAGNSSAVILPRAWLNKNVRIELVEKTPEMMLYDVISIVKRYMNLEDIIGIYLVGSYARGEQDENSDIDILVISRNIDREMIIEGNYNILLVSSELLNQKLKQDLFPIGQMIREAKPILNSNYLDSIKVEITKENVKWYLDTTESKLSLIKEIISKSQKNKKYLCDKVVYTLILRIRTLYVIKKMIRNEPYSKKEFIKLINSISKRANSYESYLNVKNNLKDKNKASIDEIKGLYDYLDNQLIELKIILNRNI